MLNKRGIGNEVDWILGVGLFMISVVFIFVLFRPGVSQTYDSKTLLDIIQYGFNNDTNWDLTTVPVFIYPANSSYASNTAAIVTLANKQIDLTCALTTPCPTTAFSNLLNLINGRDKLNINIYYLKRSAGDILLSGSNDPTKNPEQTCVTKCKNKDAKKLTQARNLYITTYTRPDGMKYNLTSNQLSIPVILEAPNSGIIQPVKTKFLLGVSDRPINFDLSNISIAGGVKFYNACSKVNEATWPLSKGVAMSCPVIYELGVTETATGIDLESFLTLNETTLQTSCQKGYECIKEKWKFPASKEFSIKIESLQRGISQPINIIFQNTGAKPSTNVNVFARQFDSFVLTEDGIRIPVVVTITTW